MSAFTLDLSTLRGGLSHLALETGAKGLDLSEAEWPGGIQGTFDVEKSGDRVSVRGFLEARALLECVRCLQAFEYPMRVAFQVFADRSGTGSRRDEDALTRDAYMKFHDGRRLDLSDDARETLLTEMPIATSVRIRAPATETRRTSMAVPKRRHSSTRGKKRRTHWKLSLPGLNTCSHCSSPKQPHRVCPNCGWYDGEEIIAPRAD